MSRFTGRQYRGAGRADRATKHREAVERLAVATKRACSHRHTDRGAIHCAKAAMFGYQP